MVKPLELRMEERPSSNGLKFIGSEFLCDREMSAPPFVFVGAYREKGKMLLSFYVDQDLRGPYWPDETGTMRLQKDLPVIDFSAMSRRTVYRTLKIMAERAEKRGNPD